MCIRQIARKTPPEKALAIPSILGFSRKDLTMIGTMPIPKASRKATMQNPSLRVSVLDHPLYTFSNQDYIKFSKFKIV